jgi:hypothetical protein
MGPTAAASPEIALPRPPGPAPAGLNSSPASTKSIPFAVLRGTDAKRWPWGDAGRPLGLRRPPLRSGSHRSPRRPADSGARGPPDPAPAPRPRPSTNSSRSIRPPPSTSGPRPQPRTPILSTRACLATTVPGPLGRLALRRSPLDSPSPAPPGGPDPGCISIRPLRHPLGSSAHPGLSAFRCAVRSRQNALNVAASRLLPNPSPPPHARSSSATPFETAIPLRGRSPPGSWSRAT